MPSLGSEQKLATVQSVKADGAAGVDLRWTPFEGNVAAPHFGLLALDKTVQWAPTQHVAAYVGF